MKSGMVVCSVALACAGLMVVSTWTGCGNDTGSHQGGTATRPVSATGPTTEEVLAKAALILPKDMEAIPDLGTAVAQKDPKTGQVWQVYPNGLAYQEISRGIGQVPQIGQTVNVQYVGSFPENGEVFDQSKADQPFSFRLGTKNIIMGWNMAVSTMHVGSKWKIRLPAALAYGQRGSPPKIKAGQTLIFEITLLGVSGRPAEAPATAPAQTLPTSTQIGPPLPPAGTATGPGVR